jgi:hypothetical protein
VNDPNRRRSPDGRDDDAIFADIVAHLNDEVAEAGPDRRAEDDSTAEIVTTEGSTPDSPPESTDPPSDSSPSTDLSPGDPPPGDPQPGDPQPGDQGDDLGEERVNQPPGLATQGDPHAVPAPQVWRAHEVDDGAEEHFEPPPVNALPAGDLQFWAIIAGMGGGPLLLLYIVFFNRDAGPFWILAAIAISIGGFALLVARMPGNREDDDDGARL